MVIPGKDRGSGPKVLPKPARGDPTAARTHPSARSRTEIPAAVSQATDSNDEPGHSGPDVPEAAVPRKSRRLQNTKGKKLRRSSRILNRKHPSNMFDGLSPSVPRSNLNAVSSIRTKRRLVLNNLSPGREPEKQNESLCIISPSAKNWPLVTQMNLPDLEEDTGDEMPAKDQDSDCGQSVDAKTSRASTLYNESRDNDLLRGSLRISAFGPNITLSQGLRARPSPWLPRAETDSDSNHSNVDCPPRWRPLNDRLRFGAELLNADPMDIDQTVGFESIGGLSDHITALKETVVFPLLYHEFFEKFKMTPPRGCLFHGPPGTGKTLVARALANECSHGSRKVSFFMRKGADCMTKWVGESERQLRLLFEQAYQMRPSIIFFDEIDALAPVRSNRQDQVHSSIVCTLLALMDGLNSRGEVVVIGATNRLDAIDPALRRTGRFDREFLFPLPDQEARKDILKIYTRQWSPALSDDTLEELAVHCVGYSGADLRGLCMEATFCALRRRYPQIYGTSLKLQLDLSSLSVTAVDFLSAMKMINPTSQLCSSTPARPLSAIIAPLLSTALQGALERLKRIFPQVTANKNNKSSPGLHDDPVMGSPLSKEESQISLLRPSAVRSLVCHRPRLLLVGRPGSGQSSHLAPALLHALEAFSVHSLEISVLNGNSSVTAEEACTQAFMGARRSAPSVLYLPHLQQWWDTAEEALRSSFLSLLQGITPSCPVLLLATSDTPLNLLHPKIQALFHEEYGEVLSLSVPSEAERRAFFQDLILRQAAETLPPASSPPPPEVLPLAPPPPPRQLTEYERRLLEEKEEDTLRELRLYLRHVTERLCYDRRFKVFTKPMEAKKVRKYQRGIKKPMNLSTLLTNIDKQRYNTVSEFMDDADLIWQNVLKFNPDGGAIERNTRHRAFALKDTLHAIIREDLDKDFERQCQGIRSRRLKRALDLDSDPENNMQKRRRRGRRSKWSSGVLPKPKRKKLSPLGYNSSSSSSQTEHSDGDAPESESSLAPQGSVQSLILQPPESSHTPKPESIAATPTKPAVTPTKPKTTAARPPKSKTTATKSTKSKTTAARPPKSKTTATKSTKAKTTATKSTKSKTTATKSSKSKTTATKHKKSKTTSAKSTKSKTTTAKSTKSKTTTAKPTKSKTTSARSTKSKSTATKPTKSKSTAARATKSKSTAARAPKSKSTAARAPKSKTTPGRPPKSKTQKCTRSQTIRPVRPKVSKQQAVSKRRPSVAEKRSHSEKVERVKKMNDKKQKNLKLDMNSGANTDAAQVDPRQLQELLQFVVVQTDGAEVEHLEKVYTAMAQCINSHRGNSNKSQLIEDLKTLCSRSAAPPESFGE